MYLHTNNKMVSYRVDCHKKYRISQRKRTVSIFSPALDNSNAFGWLRFHSFNSSSLSCLSPFDFPLLFNFSPIYVFCVKWFLTLGQRKPFRTARFCSGRRKAKEGKASFFFQIVSAAEEKMEYEKA